MRVPKHIYKILNPKKAEKEVIVDGAPICICSNEDCNKEFRLGSDCLVCQKCDKKYCSKCWYDANDEYFKWETDGTPRGQYKELLIDECDYCSFD